MEKKLFLLDAMALIYRAYYALIRNPILTSKGKNTNAQFGFTNTLFDLIKKYKPTHMAVCFDTQAPTERHIEFESYKANRPDAPEDLIISIPEIKTIVQGFNIPVIESDGYEADDIIGTLAWQAADLGYKVFMVTPDKDYGQLLTKEHVYIFKPAYMGKKEEILNAEKICAKWDIANVCQVVDVLGLMGDAVDNIPGIAGIGEKTAAKLLKEYQSLENVLDNADNIKGSLGEKIRKGKDDAILSKKLATIITDVPIQFHEEDFKIKEWNHESLRLTFSELEFKTLGRRILGEEFKVNFAENRQTDLFGNFVDESVDEQEEVEILEPEELRTIQNTPHKYKLTQTKDQIQAMLAELANFKEICFDTETTNIDANLAEMVGMSFSVKKGEGWYVPVSSVKAEVLTILQMFDALFEDRTILWIGQNIKYDLLVLKHYGKELSGKVFDTMVAHYVLEPEGRRNMDYLSEQYLGYRPISITELIGKKGKGQGNMRDVELAKVAEYAAEDADVTLQLKETLTPLLKEKVVEEVFYKVDNPLVKVLANMEFEGVRIDEQFLIDYSQELDVEARKIEENVYDVAGVRFNLASPKQLGEVLFDKLMLDKKARKTKTGQYATGEDVLLKLAEEHKIADDVLAYRELTKLRNTYVDTLPKIVNVRTGRVHTSFNQTVAVTGRLSSANPNLQNIPVRTARGREIRKAFIPRDANHLLLSADYSQIELRIVAAISGDKNMCEAFKAGEDIHAATAAKVFDVAVSDVTKEQRYKAKSVNFGIIYGQGAFGLSNNLNISRAEAKEIIDNYKKQFSGIDTYMQEAIASAQKTGYAQTVMGRKNWLRDITSSNAVVRGFAERNAINSPIQGTAADMIKLAMIAIDEEIVKHGFHSKMILQVHDELVFDVVKEELDDLKAMVIQQMQVAMPLPNNVPVIAEAGFGHNWLEAH